MSDSLRRLPYEPLRAPRVPAQPEGDVDHEPLLDGACREDGLEDVLLLPVREPREVNFNGGDARDADAVAAFSSRDSHGR